MDVVVNRKDRRYPALVTGRNLRFPESAAVAPGRIAICQSPPEVKRILQETIHRGQRPTVRSGGHCYENFCVNNPGGVLIDLSLLNHVATDPGDGVYRVQPGAVLGDVYQALYKRHGVTLPAGSCYSVGAGGHISGGGYGVLSRLHGLSSDWLTAIDILTVDDNGKVIERHINRDTDAELFRACRGAGSAGYGVITEFYFDHLPSAPNEVIQCGLHFSWDAMDETRFADLLKTYGDYWATRGRDPDTWGLFTILTVGAKKPHDRLDLYVQFCEPNGQAHDLSVLREFLALFDKFQPASQMRLPVAGAQRYDFERGRTPWLDAATGDRSGGRGARAKYKSAYMKRSFTAAEASTIYRFYSGDSKTASISVISIDSYGGAVNSPALIDETSIAQRDSIMKLQWQCYWREAGEDLTHLRELDDFYTALYSGSHVDSDHQGTPWGEGYEGCYMNYPDADMLRYSYWPHLYYGRGDLYAFLQKTKQTYDSNNIFHHAMSVRPA